MNYLSVEVDGCLVEMGGRCSVERLVVSKAKNLSIQNRRILGVKTSTGWIMKKSLDI